MPLGDIDPLGILRKFVWISGAGFVVKLASIILSPAIDSYVDSISEVSPWAGLLAAILVAASTVADIRDAYRKGLAGFAVLSFQFMPFEWVMWIFIAGVFIDRIVLPTILRSLRQD